MKTNYVGVVEKIRMLSMYQNASSILISNTGRNYKLYRLQIRIIKYVTNATRKI